MGLKFPIQFPLFAPPVQPRHHHHHTPTEIRFSRWNNANAEKFIRRERTQKEIEDQIRFQKRFASAQKIADLQNYSPPTLAPATTTFKSTGTPSTPSRPSIPGKKSKYSKPPQNPREPTSHPAFKRIARLREIPDDNSSPKDVVKIGDNGVSYVFTEMPFEFQYSYTETPKVKPLKLREPAIAPFEPGTMGRPWTGRKPLPPSKKKMVEFDSFRLPPPHKKGVKPVQAPGPFLPGSGPKYVQSREEILGEPLTKEEVDALVKGCLKSRRQLNMGRDGLTHNMLDNIHAHWKRRRVCRIKCLGVCTVDMDNVRQQLEEKTGGKVIYGKGGVLYLFRGRNYNYKIRPKFPLMLWKPVTPVYPRLIQRAPEGLTLEEASEMRKKGRLLTPICKLGKNGVYCNLVKDIREAFEACELVRINCQGMNGSDYRKIGGKLKDLVPCVLISFEYEHILMWRGKEWKSSISNLIDDSPEVQKSSIGSVGSVSQPSEQEAVRSQIPDLSIQNDLPDSANGNMDLSQEHAEILDSVTGEDLSKDENAETLNLMNDYHSATNANIFYENKIATKTTEPLTITEGVVTHHTDAQIVSPVSLDFKMSSDVPQMDGNSSAHKTAENVSKASDKPTDVTSSSFMNGVLLLLKQAVEGGNALVLDSSCLDADVVYHRAVALAQSASRGPTFRHRIKKAMTGETEKQDDGVEVEEDGIVSETRVTKTKRPRMQRTKDSSSDYINVVPQETLKVDELAKLLS